MTSTRPNYKDLPWTTVPGKLYLKYAMDGDNLIISYRRAYIKTTWLGVEGIVTARNTTYGRESRPTNADIKRHVNRAISPTRTTVKRTGIRLFARLYEAGVIERNPIHELCKMEGEYQIKEGGLIEN